MIASWPMSIVLSDAGAARMGSGDRRSLPHWRLGPPARPSGAALLRLMLLMR